MAGFRREIGTNVQVPEVSIPMSTGDDVNDALQLASFGLNLYGQYRQQELEQQKAARQQEILGDAQKITEELFNARAQKDLSVVEEQTMFNRLTSKYKNPVERQMINELVAKNLTTGLYKEAREEMLSAEQAIDKRLDSIPPEMQALVLEGQNIDQMTMEQKRKAMDKARKLQMLAAQQEEAQTSLANKPTARAFRGVLSAETQSLFGVLQEQLGSFIRQVDDAGSDPQRIELLTQSKTNLKQAISSQMNRVQASYTAAIKNIEDKDQRKMLTDEYNSYVSSLEKQQRQLDDMDAEQYDKMARMAKFMQDKSETELYRSFPKMMKLKEMSGAGFNAVMNIVLSKSPNIQTASADIIAESIEGVLGTPAGAAISAKHLDLEGMSDVLAGGDLMAKAEESRDAAAARNWNSVKMYIESPEALDSLPAEQLNNVGISMINILDRADELGDTESMANAAALLTSPALKGLVEKLPESQQAVMADYAAKSTAEFMRRRLKDDSFLTYEDGKIVSTLKRDLEADKINRQFSGSFFGGVKGQSRVSKAVQESNQKLDRAAALMVEYHPAIENEMQAREYLVGSIRPDLIKTPTIEPERKQAIEQITTLKAIQERAELDARLVNLEQRTAQAANPALSAIESQQEVQEVQIDPETELKMRVEAFKRRNPEDAKEFSDEELMEMLRD